MRTPRTENKLAHKHLQKLVERWCVDNFETVREAYKRSLSMHCRNDQEALKTVASLLRSEAYERLVNSVFIRWGDSQNQLQQHNLQRWCVEAALDTQHSKYLSSCLDEYFVEYLKENEQSLDGRETMEYWVYKRKPYRILKGYNDHENTALTHFKALVKSALYRRSDYSPIPFTSWNEHVKKSLDIDSELRDVSTFLINNPNDKNFNDSASVIKDRGRMPAIEYMIIPKEKTPVMLAHDHRVNIDSSVILRCRFSLSSYSNLRWDSHGKNVEQCQMRRLMIRLFSSWFYGFRYGNFNRYDNGPLRVLQLEQNGRAKGEIEGRWINHNKFYLGTVSHTFYVVFDDTKLPKAGIEVQEHATPVTEEVS